MLISACRFSFSSSMDCTLAATMSVLIVLKKVHVVEKIWDAAKVNRRSPV